MRSLSSGRVFKSPRIRREFRVVDSPDLTALIREAEKQEEEEEKKEQPAIAPAPPEPEDYETRRRQLEEEIGKARAEAEHLQARAEEEAAALLASAREEAEKLRREAEEERERILAEAEEEREKIREEAYAAGFEEGLRSGREEAAAEYSEKLAAAEQVRREAEEESARLLELAEEERRARIMESEGEILKLAVEIAEKIITGKIDESPEAWMQMVRKAVERVAGAKEVVVRVAPEDEEFVVLRLGTVKEVLSEAPPVQVVADSSLKKGDFVLQTDLGQVDGRLKEQLNKIAQALQEEAMGQ
jgi:flagellar assembly protein FliH